MANLAPRSALAPFLHAGHNGAEGKTGVTIREVMSCAIAELTAFKGQKEALAQAIENAFGIALPAANKSASKDGVTFVSVGPGKWLVTGEGPSEKDLLVRLEKAARSFAAVVDQSDARALVEISGEIARAALAKGIMIDLDPSAFKIGSAATSFAVQFWITLWQTNEEPTYRLAVFRSMGRDLLHWLESSAAEFGYDVR
ncbi:MAG: sarcosine oxidase subunit gamma [Hyphomicrobiales bacterium]